MEDSAQLKEKLKDLQSDVAKLRVQVPEKIVQLHEKHLKLLDERFKELEEEKLTIDRPKINSKTKMFHKLASAIDTFDHKEAIVRISNRYDKLEKAMDYIKKYES